jgi:transcriptional regulator with XRE-family HTH domain
MIEDNSKYPTLKTNGRIGQKIRRIREYRDLSQDSVAMEMGMSPSGYSRIERDEVSVTVDKLTRLADILKVSLIDLVSPEESIVFNNYGTAKDQSFSTITSSTDTEKIEQLYKEQIQLLQQEVNYLREIVNSLTKQPKA